MITILDNEKLLSLLPVLMSAGEWRVSFEASGTDVYSTDLFFIILSSGESVYRIDCKKVDIAPLKTFFEKDTIPKLGYDMSFLYKVLKLRNGFSCENLRDLGFAKKMTGVDAGDLSAISSSGLSTCFALECDAIPPIAEMELHGLCLDTAKWGALIEKHKQELAEAKDTLDRWYGISLHSLRERIKTARGLMKIGKTEENRAIVARHLLLGSPDWSAIEEEITSAKKRLTFLEKFNDSFLDSATLNYGSPKQVLEVLYALGTRIEVNGRKEELTSTDEKTLNLIRDNKFVEALKKYRSCSSLINTFGQSYIDAIHPVTGRIQIRINQLGTETGRIATQANTKEDTYKSINMLNIPRDNEVRECFAAPEGYVIETDDYSSCELRILAHISGDLNMIKAFKSNVDLHSEVASRIYGVVVTKDANSHLRNIAKTLNFGIAYGMSPYSLSNKLNISKEEAIDVYMRYRKEFKTALDFLESSGNTASKRGWLQNLSGRRRVWCVPDPRNTEKYLLGNKDIQYKKDLEAIKREGGNFLIQSVNADITKLAMIKIHSYIKKMGVRSGIMLQVYDEIVTCTHKDDTEKFHPIKKKLMIEAGRHWITSVPIEVESFVSTHWTA
jgi:hypothetical protein